MYIVKFRNVNYSGFSYSIPCYLIVKDDRIVSTFIMKSDADEECRKLNAMLL